MQEKNGIMHINIIKKTLEFDIHTNTYSEEALSEFSSRCYTISFNHNSSSSFPSCYLLLEIRRLLACSETRNLFLLQINIRNKTK